ncbi:NB-ARC domain-containing protein [Cryptosporangium japonicum]|uniref:NB-ARC domain-containing protein n=1 Tax=Cryptosporangium japonicum TaxID=80872 RepID=UPI0031E2C2C4
MPLRVFLSHTGELASFPEGLSYVDAAIEAVGKAGHVPVDMRWFPPADSSAGRESSRVVLDCDVYVGILGHRYGSPVPGDPDERSYCELEFDTATEGGLTCLVLQLDLDAPVPARFHEAPTAHRQEAFRKKAQTGRVAPSFDSPARLKELLTDALRAIEARSRPILAPHAPADVIDRPELSGSLVTALIEATVGVIGIHGAGGIGKTTLAQLVCGRPGIAARYPGGVLWVTLGEHPAPADIAVKVNDLVARLTGDRPSFADPEQAGLHLGEVLTRYPAVLLVVDDVWNAVDLQPFLHGPSTVTRLVTTRDRNVLPPMSRRVPVDPMTSDQARALLVTGALDALDEASVDQLIALTGGWPLLLRLVQGILDADIHEGAEPRAAAARLAGQIAADGPAVLALEDADDRQHAFDATIRASLATLAPARRARYAELAIFDDDTEIPLDVLELLWGETGQLTPDECRRFVRTLSARSLALYRADQQTLRLHDVLHAYLRHSSEQTAAHLALLRAARTRLTRDSGTAAWWTLPAASAYLRAHVTVHLVAAGQADQAGALVERIEWMTYRLRHEGPGGLQIDLARAGHPRGGVLSQAVGQNAHLLVPADPPQSLETTLRSRLDGYAGLGSLIAGQPADAAMPRIANRWPLPDRPDPALLRTLTAHTGPVRAVAVSSEGTLLVTGSEDGAALVWDARRGAVTRSLDGHSGGVRTVAISPDGTWIATGGDDRKIRIWDVRTGDLLRTLTGHRTAVQVVVVSPDGSGIMSGSSGGTVRIWDSGTGALRRTLPGRYGAVRALAVSPDGAWLATAGDDASVRRWNAADGTLLEVRRGHDDGTLALAVSPDGEWLASGGRDWSVRIRGVRTAQSRWGVKHQAPVQAITWAAGGTRVASASSDGVVHVWDPRHRREVRTLTGHTSAVGAAALSPDGRLLFTASHDRTVRVWNPDAGTPRISDERHPGRVYAVALSADGTRVVTGGGDGRVRICDARTGAIASTLAGHLNRVNTAAISPGGGWIVTADHDGTMQVWNAPRQTHVRTLTGHRGHVHAAAFTPSGTRIVTGGADTTVRIWDVHSGAKIRALTGHTRRVYGVAVSPDERWIVSVGHDGIALVWDLRTGERLRTLDGHTGPVTAVGVAPDGTWIVTASGDRTVRLWDADTGDLRRTLDGHAGPVNAVAVAPDGRWIASASSDRTVRIWDPAAGRGLVHVRVDGPLFSVAVGADGLVAAGGAAGLYGFEYYPPT